MPADAEQVHQELTSLVNRLGLEQNSDTPDYIIVEFLHTCLFALHDAIKKREEWYGRKREQINSA